MKRFGRKLQAGFRRHGAAISLLCAMLMPLSACANLSDEDVLYGANDQPRLRNGEAARSGPLLNLAAVNAEDAARVAVPFTGYVGSLRIDYAPDTDAIVSDVVELGDAGATNFDPNQSVTVEFEAATIDYVLQQLLGGALGVNYIAPAELGGAVTFRTEVPIPKGQVLQVVRDVLSREGLELRLLNGVFHVGTPELIAQVDETSSIGNSGEQVTRIVRLPENNARDVTALVSQLLPENINVLLSTAADTVVVRANPNDIDAVENMILTLSAQGVTEEQVAVVPLRESSPGAVVTQLQEFYGNLLAEDEALSLVPLESQQAILIGSSDQTLLAGVTQLIRQLDRSTADEVSLRIIPLQYLVAEEVAEQMAEIFGAEVAAPAAAAAPTVTVTAEEGEDGGAGRLTFVPTLPQGTSPLSDDEDSVPTIPPTQLRFETTPPQGGRGGGNPDQVVADGFDRLESGGGGGGPTAPSGAPRIVADPRTNSIMVFSTYTVYRRMTEVLQALDIPQSQVVIEATVIEVDLSDELQSGVQFLLEGSGVTVGSSGSIAPAQGAAGGYVGIGASLGDFDVEAVLSALNAVTRVKVISSPYITVLDGRSARLLIGDQIPFTTRSQESDNEGTTTVTQEIEVLDTGILLEVTPRIHSTNSVDLTINQSVSTPAASAAAGDLTPIIATREIESQILAQSGRTILLGGLIQDRLERERTGTPGLSEVPLLGGLFRSDSDRVRRVELLVLITPRVIRQSSQIEDLTRSLRTHFHTTYQQDLVPLGGGPAKP